MYKKLSLALVALIIIMVAISLPVLAEPENDNNTSVESTSSIVSDETQDEENSSTGENEDGSSSNETDSESGDASSDETSGGEQDEVSSDTSSTASKFYIPDDSTYFTESLNSLGGNVTSGSITIGDESNVSSTVQNNDQQGNGRFSLQDLLKKFLWIPIAVIAICVLVLILFNKVYELKYKAIDPEEKIKAQKRADERRKAAAKRVAERRKGNNPRRPK